MAPAVMLLFVSAPSDAFADSPELFSPPQTFPPYAPLLTTSGYEVEWRLRHSGGSAGTKPAVDGDGNIFLFEGFGSPARVRKYDADGDFQWEREFAAPRVGLDHGASGDGHLYVLTGNPDVVVYDPAGIAISRWALPSRNWARIAAEPRGETAFVAQVFPQDASGTLPPAVQRRSRTGALLGEWRVQSPTGGFISLLGDLAVGPGGNVYAIVFVGAQLQVHVYDPTGTLLAFWGNPSADCGLPGRLCIPLNIAVDAGENVWVDGAEDATSLVYAHVLKFSAAGEFLLEVRGSGCGMGGFEGFSQGIFLAAGPAGSLYVQPGFTCGVLQRFTNTGTYVRSYRTGAFRAFDVATAQFGADGNTYLVKADFNDARLVRVDGEGRATRELRRFPAADYPLTSATPPKIATDAANNVYVPLPSSCRIVGVDADEVLADVEFGSGCGPGPGQLTPNAALATAVDPAGLLYVLDPGCAMGSGCPGAGRIVAFDTESTAFVLEWRTPPTEQPRDLAVGPDGAVYVLTSPGRLHRYSPDGTLEFTWSATLGAATLAVFSALDVDGFGTPYFYGGQGGAFTGSLGGDGVIVLGARLFTPFSTAAGLGDIDASDAGDLVVVDAGSPTAGAATIRLRSAPATGTPPVADAEREILFYKLFGRLGGSAAWTIFLVNNGARSAAPFTVTEGIQPGQTFLSSSPVGAFDASAGTLTWAFTSLPPGAAVDLSYSTRLGGPFPDGVQGSPCACAGFVTGSCIGDLCGIATTFPAGSDQCDRVFGDPGADGDWGTTDDGPLEVREVPNCTQGRCTLFAFDDTGHCQAIIHSGPGCDNAMPDSTGLCVPAQTDPPGGPGTPGWAFTGCGATSGCPFSVQCGFSTDSVSFLDSDGDGVQDPGEPGDPEHCVPICDCGGGGTCGGDCTVRAWGFPPSSTAGECLATCNCTTIFPCLPIDPNAKSAAPADFILPDAPIFYATHFENVGLGVAFDVAVDDTLDASLDEQRLSLLTPGAHYDAASRTITWDLTGLHLAPGEGGMVAYLVYPKPGLASGTIIRNQSTIFFDGSPTDTNTVVHVVDGEPPVSRVEPLPLVSPASFDLCWSADDGGLSGVAGTSLFVSTDGGSFAPLFEVAGASGCTTFEGGTGHSFCVVSLARDVLGNEEALRTTADACTSTGVANQPPVARCANVAVPADEQCLADAFVDAGSFDPEGEPVVLIQDHPGPYSAGDTIVTLLVSDGESESSCTATVSVLDVTSPNLEVSLNPTTLWPPNHGMVPIAATFSAQDNCDSGLPVEMVSTVSSEPDDAPGGGDGATTGDIDAPSASSIRLRAERAGSGPGRTYTLTFAATDVGGNRGERTATVVVPHNR